MTATDDITHGECLFAIPRSMLLHPGNCSISRVFEKDPLKSKSGWAELLIALMYEYTNPESKWKPYFELVPNFKKLDLPMFWPKNDRDDLLRGTGVSEAVNRDLDNISTEFHDVVLPYINRHKEIQWHGTLHKELKFYKQMVAFVMAYSFTENSQDWEEQEEGEGQTEATPPMMVPMADILNHVAKNNTHLSFEKEFLKMVATKDIRKGEEVYNTYGELANWHLLHMYGFAEEYPLNHYDTVSICTCTCMSCHVLLKVQCHMTMIDASIIL
ncbi:hypothetical protein FSP39_010000 [Pinctada imbricata]|uniref:SET domain-containing protein n=1 Tax=Pinctada imbricata TaxID=66713 RepID=A0AA88XF64_PINIB|nr:hypothetical protein FSP39_010000 [Pinctada imbricata]